jgi:hypothetical protein
MAIKDSSPKAMSVRPIHEKLPILERLPRDRRAATFGQLR